jgi:hypothetical protein
MSKYFTKIRENGEPYMKEGDNIEKYLFATKPGRGAAVFNPSKSEWLQ